MGHFKDSHNNDDDNLEKGDSDENLNEEEGLPFGEPSPLYKYLMSKPFFPKKEPKVVTGFIKHQMDEKLSRYEAMFGQAEIVSLMEKLRTSKLFNQNLQIALAKADVPNCETIGAIIHSSNYSFLLAKKRKIYFGSLFFLRVLYEGYEVRDLEIDEDRFANTLFAILEKYP